MGAVADDRAVSEVIAFVLVFAIVITSVGVLYTVGFGGLSEIQETEQSNSAQQAFEALAIAFDEIQRDRGPNRLADVDLSGRTLFVDESSELVVSVNGTGVTTVDGALIYRGDGTDVAYEAGAVIRADDDDAQIVTREPRFRCLPSQDRALISLVDLSDGGTGGLSSSGSIGILAEQRNQSASRLKRVERGGPITVTIDYSGSEYAGAWENYFQDQSEWTVNAAADTATCGGVDGGPVFVRQTDIAIDYVGI